MELIIKWWLQKEGTELYFQYYLPFLSFWRADVLPSPLAGGEVVCLLKLPVNAVVPLVAAVVPLVAAVGVLVVVEDCTVVTFGVVRWFLGIRPSN